MARTRAVRCRITFSRPQPPAGKRSNDRIAERLAVFADAVPGNCLALFPSYSLSLKG
jgi:Rad3-related DNA helicase